MKKIAMLLLCLLMGMGVFAQQKGDKAIGMNLLYGNDTNLGLSAKLRYNITDRVRVEPAFEYYFKHNYASMWDAGANLHYVIPAAEKLAVYPLAGLAYFHATAYLSDLGEWISGYKLSNASAGKMGVQLGLGGDYQLSGATLSLEAKYQIIDGSNQFAVTFGISVPF